MISVVWVGVLRDLLLHSRVEEVMEMMGCKEKLDTLLGDRDWGLIGIWLMSRVVEVVMLGSMVMAFRLVGVDKLKELCEGS